MKRTDKRTREQRKADHAAWMGFISFLALLLISITYMVVNVK